ncbi:MAG: hypothetical protein AAF902_20125 [Chloroflexota bacterium]
MGGERHFGGMVAYVAPAYRDWLSEFMISANPALIHIYLGGGLRLVEVTEVVKEFCYESWKRLQNYGPTVKILSGAFRPDMPRFATVGT